MTEDLVGRTLAGKYRLERLLGRGGMGAVYEGKNLEIGRRVAIKVLANDVRDHPEVHARFRREARAASAIESEHIVQVFDVGHEPEAGLFMVMELLRGEDLEARLRREGRLDAELTKIIAKQILRGLARAHGAGVVHRDLKPANIFLVAKDDGSPFVKIVDFGISKFGEIGSSAGSAATGTAITRLGNAIGTAQYMSPEQAQGLTTLDHRTDIWSLGSLLYECLSGDAPFPEAATYEQTIVRIVTMRAAPLLSVAPWVPPALAAAVDTALRHAPEERHADCAAFLRAIDHDASLDRSSTLPLSVRASTPSIAPEDRFFAPSSRGRTELVSVSPVFSSEAAHEDDSAPRGVPRATSNKTAAAVIGAALATVGLLVFTATRDGASPAPPAATGAAASATPSASSELASDAGLALVPLEPSPAEPPALQPTPPQHRPATTERKPGSAPQGSKPATPPAQPPQSTKPATPPATATPQPARAFGGAGVTDKY